MRFALLHTIDAKWFCLIPAKKFHDQVAMAFQLKNCFELGVRPKVEEMLGSQ
jgi:hypothetical protein